MLFHTKHLKVYFLDRPNCSFGHLVLDDLDELRTGVSISVFQGVEDCIYFVELCSELLIDVSSIRHIYDNTVSQVPFPIHNKSGRYVAGGRIVGDRDTDFVRSVCPLLCF